MLSEIQRKTLEIEKKQAELNALQSQINPHFLFNTLDSIRMRSVLKTSLRQLRLLSISREHSEDLFTGVMTSPP